MSWTPNEAAVKITPDIQKALETASADQVKEIMTNAMLDQGLVVRDVMNPSVLLPTALADATPKRFAQTLTDPTTGKKIIFEADSELDVTKQVNAYMREHFPQPATPDTRSAQPRDTNGRFVERLQEATQDVQNTRLMQSWEQATQEFLQSPEGASWPGGNRNVELIGKILLQENLMEAEDKTAALVAAYRHARENNLLTENEEVKSQQQLHSKLASATNFGELRDHLVQARGGASGLFD